MAVESLAVRSLNFHEGDFNWVFLVWYLVSALLTILFLFYFNRLFASLVSYGIRAYFWHYYRVDVSAQALQVSLLAGRIFFKNIRYLGQNETIVVHDGYLTWRYWLRHTQSPGYQNPPLSKENNARRGSLGDDDTRRSVDEGAETGKRRELKCLPCRVLLKACGVEWFVYNRSPAYDAIFRSMEKGDVREHAQQKPRSNESSHKDSEEISEKEQLDPRQERKDDAAERNKVVDDKNPSIISTGSSMPDYESKSSLPVYLNLLPIGVECSKGAFVMGNRNTRAIVTGRFESVTGRINAKESFPADQYKQTFEFDFIHPVIEFKHNKDFTEAQSSEGAHWLTGSGQNATLKSRWLERSRYCNRVRRALTSLRDLIPYRRGSVESLNNLHTTSAGAKNLTDEDVGAYGQHRWLGLTRYLNDDDDLVEQERWKAVEYGNFPTIVDSPKISMNLSWDVPGLVPELPDNDSDPFRQLGTNINGDIPPDWGIDLKVCGGIFHYGPWADRQRSDLQAVFFPTLYKDAVPATRLAPGENRVSTALKVFIELEEETTVRVPTREESKDWRWRGHKIALGTKSADGKKPKHHGRGGKSKKRGQTSEERPAGWLDVKILPDSTVSFSMDLVAGAEGYQNRVDFDLKGLDISSSVNHTLLWRSRSQIIKCDLSNPLAWNTLRRWRVDVHDNGTELFMLRDHMFLLTDLINDWTSGPPGEYHTFVPFEYSIALRFDDFRLYLNANDSNIVNNPSDLDDNTLVILRGNELMADLVIPTKSFRPIRNTLTFSIEAFGCGLQLHTPPRNTQHTFLKSFDVASLQQLDVTGSYNYFATTSPALTDTLFMDVHGASFNIHAYGFLIRYFMKIKDNYFGDDIHFRTLEEYQAQLERRLEHSSENAVEPQHNRVSNDLDVILGIAAENLEIFLPAHLYSSDVNTRLEILSVNSDLRITNYYMDLSLSTAPIAVSHKSCSERDHQDFDAYSSTQIFIEGLRVFGHRLFGLPPTEPTYVCNWDFDVGSITGEFSMDFLQCLTMALRCFGFAFDDMENALPPLHSDIIHDVTFLRARLKPISLGLRMEQAAFLLGTGPVSFDFNDWAGALFSDKCHLIIPNLTLAVADVFPTTVNRSIPESTVSTHALLQTTVELHGVDRKDGFHANRELQQSHVALHDTRTQRVPWLVHDYDQHFAIATAYRANKSKAPAMPYPPMPNPTFGSDTGGLNEVTSMSSSSKSGSSFPRSTSSSRSSFFVSSTSPQGRVTGCHIRTRNKIPRRRKEKGGSLMGIENNRALKLSTTGLSAPGSIADEADDEVLKRDAKSSPTLAKIGLSFSSPYKKPHFPLLATKIDKSELPSLPKYRADDNITDENAIFESPNSRVPRDHTTQASFVLDTSPGIQAFCTPMALFLMIDIVNTFQPKNANSQLDYLQIYTMNELASGSKEREKKDQIFDFRLIVPWMAVRFVNAGKAASQDRQDRYNLVLDHLNVIAARSSRLSNTNSSTRSSQLSVHLVLNQMTCSATEILASSVNNLATVSLSIYSPIFWILYGTSATVEVQFDKLDVRSISSRFDYISSLLQHTLVLYKGLAARFKKKETERKSRIQALMLSLSTVGDDIPNPPFLTRASYVLRGATHHIRTNESWKMMSRLRYVYQSIQGEIRDKINSQCILASPSCPQNASQRVTSSFSRWQFLDTTQAQSCLLMQKVYGESQKSLSSVPEILPFKANFRTGGIRILVDPGPKQNEIVVRGLAVGVAMKHSLLINDSVSQDISESLPSTIQIHCLEIAIRLNWSLLGLLENIIESVRTPADTKLEKQGAPSMNHRLFACCPLHVVVSSELSVLSCDTPNMKIVSLCQGIKTSFVLSRAMNNTRKQSISILLDADVVTSEIKSHSTLLTLYKLRQPRVFGTNGDNADQSVDEQWKFSSTGQHVLFQVFANPLQLLEATDCFLEYEITHLVDWTKSLRSKQSYEENSSNILESSSLSKTKVALHLESYAISVGILPSLTYQIDGKRARSFVKTGQHGKHDLTIDFDLYDHSHIFKADNEASDASSALQMPHISGQLSLDLGPVQRSSNFGVLIGNIVFDASAVHSIFTTLSRPEIVYLGNSITREVSVISNRSKAVFDMVKANRSSTSSKPTLYSGTITAESIALHAHASDTISDARGAELEFKICRVHLSATNEQPDSWTAMTFPDFTLQLKSIDLNILRFDEFDLQSCGNLTIQAVLRSTSRTNDASTLVRSHEIKSSSLQVNVYPKTAPVIVLILIQMQEKLKSIDFSQEVQNLKKLRRVGLKSESLSTVAPGVENENNGGNDALFDAMYSLEMTNICVTWRIEDSIPTSPDREPENLILSFTKIDLATKKHNAARLLVENLQLQMVPASQMNTFRSLNSALLPEVLFNVAYVSTARDRRLAFQVAGKSLDLRLTSQFILPMSNLRRSIAHSVQEVRLATADRIASGPATDAQTRPLIGNKKLASLLVDADFAGAVVFIQGRSVADPHLPDFNVIRGQRLPQHGRYNQFTPGNEDKGHTTLRAPGFAFKMEYKHASARDPSLNAEMKVDASSNILYPAVVPLVMEISSAVKELVADPSEQGNKPRSSLPQPKFLEDQRLRGGDPAAILGHCRLNLGLRICRQEFSLSCQPIARVAATARFDDIYITINTAQSQELGKFFTVSGACTGLQASVQHVYSRESTGNFDVDSVVVSLMNSKHVSATNGISAILNISPMKAQINGKQSQEFLLFREIWIPPEIRQSRQTAVPTTASEQQQAYIVQRYQQIAATSAFPWNATISVAGLDIQVDLGQSVGKSAFMVSKLWISSKKTSDWEQNLCLGFKKMGVKSTGRMSGFVELCDLKVRTSIQWPAEGHMRNQTPLVQASSTFDKLHVKAAFDYQAFAIADIALFEFLMYNVKDSQNASRDRLVSVLDGEKLQIFCTTTSASQIVALSQAFQRLFQEKRSAYETSLQDIEKFLRRKSSLNTSANSPAFKRQKKQSDAEGLRSSLKLQTDVMVALRAVNIGAFPNTFFDNQIFKLEALNTSARFTVLLEGEQIHSTLSMTLGQLRIALASITRESVPKTLGEVSVVDVVKAATESRGGTILKVPKLVATMETWQNPISANIDYIFKSSFQGRVDVGWNYSRISYIRGMWASHVRALAQRLGKPLPQSAVRITGGPQPEGGEGAQISAEDEQGKITAEVNVPQSKYQYTALEPPIVETPQLRDMGEATPPLEWIGLHRQRLPNLTHQIVIVSLLEVAKEVGDAYSTILGST
ncbi:Macrophage colony-stimulating factor 1 receptor [Lecanora helva]